MKDKTCALGFPMLTNIHYVCKSLYLMYNGGSDVEPVDLEVEQPSTPKVGIQPLRLY